MTGAALALTDDDMRLLRAAIALSKRAALRGNAPYGVYALSLSTMTELAGHGADEILIGCAEVLGRGMRTVEVAGPALEDEARRAFQRAR